MWKMSRKAKIQAQFFLACRKLDGIPDMTPPANSAANSNFLGSRQEVYITFGSAFFVECLFLYSFFHSAAVQHDRANLPSSYPAGMISMQVCFLLLPILVCWLLLSARAANLVSAGAGMACGYFSALLLASPVAVLTMLLYLGLSASDRGFDHGLLLAGVALVALFAISIRIARATWRIRNLERNRFLAGVAGAIVYVFAGFRLMVLVASFR